MKRSNSLFTKGNMLSRLRRMRLKKPSKALVLRTKTFRVLRLNYSKTLENVEQVGEYLKSRPFLSLVVLPWVLMAIYLVMIKTPIYESTAKVLIEKNQAEQGMSVNIGFLGQAGGGDSQNNNLTKEYISSREMLAYLQKKIFLLSHYQSENIEWFSRLSARAKSKKKLAYFQSKVGALFDPVTDELTIYSRAFDAQFSKVVLEEVISHAKKFANRVANKMANEQYSFSTQQLEQAKKKLYASEKAVLTFQNEHNMFDPKETIALISQVMGKLKEKLVEKQTTLITYQSFMQENASKIISIKEEIDAIKKQIQQQTTTMLGDEKGKLNTLLAEYSWLELGLKFAQAEYTASQQAFDLARINVSKQKNILIEISSPNLPDEYEYPWILYDLVTLFAGFLILFALIKMTYMIIQEHVD